MKQEDIIKTVCYYYKRTPEEIFATTRVTPIVKVRHLIFSLIYENCDKTLYEIGQIRKQYSDYSYNHATVYNGINKTNNRLETDKEFKKDYREINKLLGLDLKFEAEKEEPDVHAIRQYYEKQIHELKENIVNITKGNKLVSEILKMNKEQSEYFYHNRWEPYKQINKI